MKRKRGPYNQWTDKDLNLVCYLRYVRHWPFSKIQKANFPLLSQDSVKGAYRHLPTEERTRRALAAVPSIAKSRHTVERSFSRQDQPALSNLELEPSHSNSTNIEAEPTPSISHDNNSRRYNLRPSRPKIFAERKPRYMVDRNRFPHFFESYRDSIKPNELPDSEYIPPSHTPTPSSSEHSPSIISSPPSEISSLELFGLEARSPELSNHTPSALSICSSDSSSTEFFSTEEP